MHYIIYRITLDPEASNGYIQQCWLLPKDSAKAQLQGRSNLRRMMQEIPLADEETSAVEDGIAALNNLTHKLADMPTPDGRTSKRLVQITRKGE